MRTHARNVRTRPSTHACTRACVLVRTNACARASTFFGCSTVALPPPRGLATVRPVTCGTMPGPPSASSAGAMPCTWVDLEAVLRSTSAPQWLWEYARDWFDRGALDVPSLCGLRRP
eukprot:11162886-Lingulodinium_polyedra.AAC.1